MSLPKVDFYVVEQPHHNPLILLCQTLEQLLVEEETMFIGVPSMIMAKQLDQLLWTFNDTSFVPHSMSGQDQLYPALIQIGIMPVPSGITTLVNLTESLPPLSEDLKNIIEFVPLVPEQQQRARERYKQYREMGCQLQTHKLQNNNLKEKKDEVRHVG